MHLDAPYFCKNAGGKHLKFIAHMHLTVPERAGNYGAASLDSEHAIDGEPRKALAFSFIYVLGNVCQARFQLIDALAGFCGNGNDGCACKRRICKKGAQFFACKLDPFFVYKVAFGKGYYAVAHIEQLKDGQMLFRLRHHAIVGCNAQKGDVHARCAGNHLADEFFVSGNIYESNACAPGQFELRKAQFDGDAAFLFFFQSVGVNTRHCLDQA